MKQFNYNEEKSIFIKPVSMIKKNYISPKAEQILLDKDFSLALESSPPIGPYESYLEQESLQKQPYIDNLA